MFSMTFTSPALGAFVVLRVTAMSGLLTSMGIVLRNLIFLFCEYLNRLGLLFLLLFGRGWRKLSKDDRRLLMPVGALRS